MKSPLTRNLIPNDETLMENNDPTNNSLLRTAEVLVKPRKRSALKSGDLSYMKSRMLHEAVTDPAFIDELMSNNSRQSKQARFDDRPPVVHIRPSEVEDEYNVGGGLHSLTADQIIRRKQVKVSQLGVP